MHFYPTVFKVTPSGTFTTLVAFAPSNGVPSGGPLLQGSDGNFYGTTRNVGANGDGTVFKMTPSGMLTTLISFDFSTGEYPSAGLIEGNDGNFYGTTAGDSDETVDSIFPDAGTMFKITPSGMLTTLVAFDLTKGVNPLAPVVEASDGNFYGTTSSGGAGYGTVFKVTPSGSLTTLVSFNSSNGVNPEGLMQASDGQFYGTTLGGASGIGTVFKITPSGLMGANLSRHYGLRNDSDLGSQAVVGNTEGTLSFRAVETKRNH